MVRLYQTYVRPLFEYGSISFLSTNVKQLQRVQNDFIRISLRLPNYIRSDLLHEAAGLELLETRLRYLNCKLIKKMLVHEPIKLIVEKSLSTITLNNYKSPLDSLINYITD